MEIVQVKIEDLKPAEYNPRKWNRQQIEQLKGSIGKFGLVEPIVANKAQGRENIVIGGHFRLYVAKLFGFTEVPVAYISIPELSMEKELNLRLNKNLGEFDYKMLAEFDEDLLKAVGFTAVEIDRTFDLHTSGDNFDADAEAAKIQTPTAQQGDVYQLGNHRLMCGDSTKEEDVKKLMGGVRANLVFTDPPYMVDYHSERSYSNSLEKFGNDGKKIFNDNLDEEKAFTFYVNILKNLYIYSEDDAPIYWWYAAKNSVINMIAFTETGWHYGVPIIWLKDRMVLSRTDFHRCYEPCIFGWKKGKSHFKNKDITNLKDVWTQININEFHDMLDVWFQKRDNTAEYVHPTQKPVKLAERALRKSTKHDSVVLDLFGGSGSTLIACEQMQRRAYLMELDPKYVDVIIKRWETLTNQKAKKI